MFTGIVEEVGTIAEIGQGKITVLASKVLSDAKIGDSIAVNGICLTVTAFSSHHFSADVMPETLRRTSLGELKRGSPVNLERALSLSDRLGGHIVSGHIDGVGRISGIKEEANAVLMTISAEEELLRNAVEKGSIALDGISLTIVHVGRQDVTVSLIPHTRDATNLKEKRVGNFINIETDIIGKYVEKRMMEAKGTGITKDFLISNGF